MMSAADGPVADPALAKNALGAGAGSAPSSLPPPPPASAPVENTPSGEAELTADGGHQSPSSQSPSTSAGAAQPPRQQARASLDGTTTAGGGAPGAFASASLATATALPPASDSEHRLALPRGSRVLVKGNARTKKELIGLECVVRKAVGLGGWHWLVSSDCPVRLRRKEERGFAR
jgi:hypothetical protein